jgi:aryl-alcohol dehydrogenase-like predicted oxidoreductase
VSAPRAAPPRVELAPGYTIAPLITGCWQLANDHGALAGWSPDLERRWDAACAAGYTTFDCADIYPGVEATLGRWLARRRDPDAVRVHTKFVPDRGALAALNRRAVERAVERSCRRLGREALDLVQFHWWDFSVPGWLEAAGWLAELRHAGKVCHVGLTNFDLGHLRQVVEAGIPVTSVQVQYSVLDRRPARALADWCGRRGIGVLAYGTLAGGLLGGAYAGRGDPAAGGEPANRSLAKYRLIVDEIGGWGALQEIVEALATVAARRGTTPATAAIRWVLERPGVAAAIVGASRRDRLAEVAALWSADWRDERWSELEAVLERWPGPAGAVYGLEREPGSRHLAILRMDRHGMGDP